MAAEDASYIYSVLRVGGQRTAMGGKVERDGRAASKHSEEEAAKAHAEALNELLAGCTAEDYTRKEARRTPCGRAWYFHLNAAELRELGVV